MSSISLERVRADSLPNSWTQQIFAHMAALFQGHTGLVLGISQVQGLEPHGRHGFHEETVAHSTRNRLIAIW